MFDTVSANIESKIQAAVMALMVDVLRGWIAAAAMLVASLDLHRVAVAATPPILVVGGNFTIGGTRRYASASAAADARRLHGCRRSETH